MTARRTAARANGRIGFSQKHFGSCPGSFAKRDLGSKEKLAKSTRCIGRMTSRRSGLSPQRQLATKLACNRRGAVGVEGLDRLQPPGLALLALFLGPDDRLPVGRQDQPRAGVGDRDAVATGLPDIKEEGLLDRMLVRAGLDVDAVLEEDIGGAQDLLAAVDGIGDVMEASLLAVMIPRVGEVVALVRHGHPHRGFRAVIEDDLFGGTQTKIGLEEEPVRLDVDGEAIEMVEPA